jgi:flagellar assembly protein FliH
MKTYMSNTEEKIRFSKSMSFVSSGGGSNVVITDESGGDAADQLATLEAEEAEAVKKKAFQEGWNACEQQMAQQIEALNAQLNSVAAEIPASISAYFRELEEQVKVEVGELAFRISHMILKDEIGREDRMRAVIAEALAPVTDFQGVKLHINPEISEKLSGEGQAPVGVEIIPDPSLAPGEALLETSQGFIDATLDARLGVLQEKFQEMLQEDKARNNSAVENA